MSWQNWHVATPYKPVNLRCGRTVGIQLSTFGQEPHVIPFRSMAGTELQWSLSSGTLLAVTLGHPLPRGNP